MQEQFIQLVAIHNVVQEYHSCMEWFVIAKKLLKDQGKIYDDLAEHLNVSPGAVGHYMVGRREPTLAQVRNVAKYLGVSVAVLLGEEEYHPQSRQSAQGAKIIDSLHSEEEKDRAVKILAVALEPPKPKSSTN